MKLLDIISKGLYLTEDEAKRYIATMPRRYKRYHIAKRNSDEKRLIAQPARQVKSIQRSVISIIHDEILIHENAYAYASGSDIKKNAEMHRKNKYILKMDFKNFFLSIKPHNLFHVFEKQGIILDDEDFFVYGCLFFWKQRRNSPLRLSIGAPSSPFISNAIMFFFDDVISNKCKEIDISYTRYADDMTFSTNNKGILFDLPKLVRNTLNDVGLKNIKINHEKTVFSSKKFNRHVTGITITNDETLSIGREKKRLLRTKIDYYRKGLLNPSEVMKLKGELGFAKFIEEDFIERMIKKYGVEIIESIKKFEINE
ncbi:MULTISPECIES: retron St85 family RNA-directed DNA polymerase [Pectobacterium]|uniref:retron St85 family RNA-directed DNA polymerase n=1 Tax=Pectobacterium TaxID=122277 RepID=UPI001F39796F|nr:retron St85 family RNA-directed DNA polymerase [Pectobacterium versatile]